MRLHRALREEGYQVGLTAIHEYLRERAAPTDGNLCTAGWLSAIGTLLAVIASPGVRSSQ
jgi:hypothetical protein